jgi:nucleoside-diphosphate-sugar epimerase
MDSGRPLVLVGGGSGFVGTALASALSGRFRVAGLSRSPRKAEPPFDEWRCADLFNLREAKAALAGAKYAFYLVHSMLPSARLTQGSFEDLDLICADNFARAAVQAGVEQIVYLGGLIPSAAGALSPHLASRLEVEQTLGRYGVPLTTLRAGMVIGGGGSSFEILVRLVRRLPAMVCPRWTLTRMQPVAVDDVVRLLSFAVARPECYGQTFDVGASEAMSYRELMSLCADLLGLHRTLLPIRLFTPWLSKLWVQLVTGAPGELVGPLVESLRHEMVARDLRLAAMAGMTPTSVREALRRALGAGPASLAAPRQKHTALVRSVQRMRLPEGRDARWAAVEYARWLPRAFRSLLRVETDAQGTCRFFVPLVRAPLLVLTPDEKPAPDRQLFFVTSGLLARAGERGRFELRQVLDGRTLLTAIHDYAPRLPWVLYRWTQARVHAWVMGAFRRHLAQVARVQAAGEILLPAPVSGYIAVSQPGPDSPARGLKR